MKRRYTWVVRRFFALVFILAGVAHFILGRVDPDGYVVFADTTLLPSLQNLWMSFVMPNIGWLTILLGVFQILCGGLILWNRTAVYAVWGMIAFLVFILVLGYGLEADNWWMDLVKNRLLTVVMIAALVPLGLPQTFKRQRSS